MSGWPNKRARAYLGGDPPGLGGVTAIGSGREHVFWCVSCRRLDRASKKLVKRIALHRSTRRATAR